MEKNKSEVRNLATELKEIDFKKLIILDKESNLTNNNSESEFKLGKVIMNSQESNRRVEEKCEVRVYFQKYLCQKEGDLLKVYNRDYKQISAKHIDKMTLNETIIRKCLLTMFDRQAAWFIVHRDLDPEQWKIAMKDLKADDPSKYRDYLYYLINIEAIVYPQPIEPKAIQHYDRFIKKYQEEVRYLISKDLFKDAISWCNSITQKFFNMNKELRKQMTEDIKKKLLPEMKSIFLNKSLALMKKQNKDTKKDFEEVIKLVTKEYYVNFPGQKDDKYIKITARLAKSYLEVRDLEKCEETLKELKELSTDQGIVDLEKELKEAKKQINPQSKKSLIDFFNYNKTEDTFQEDAFIWDTAMELEEINLDANLDRSVINTIKD